jgi:hypothetical protein
MRQAVRVASHDYYSCNTISMLTKVDNSVISHHIHSTLGCGLAGLGFKVAIPGVYTPIKLLTYCIMVF